MSKVVKFDKIDELINDQPDYEDGITNQEIRSSSLLDYTRNSFPVDIGSNNRDDDCLSNDAVKPGSSMRQTPALLPT